MSAAREGVRERGGTALRLVIEPERLGPGRIELTRARDGAAYHYLCRVRRARVGQELVLVDGQGRQASATVRRIDRSSALLEVLAIEHVVAPPGCRIIVAPALIKGERMDECVHKLVELGAWAIAPITTERTVVRLDEARARKREDRFREIARDAVRQSERLFLPRVHPIRPLDAFLAERDPCALELVAFTGDGSRPLAAALPAEAPASVCLMVGPEGGFAAHEVEACARAGYQPVSLGRYILRADTASVAALAALGMVYGEAQAG